MKSTHDSSNEGIVKGFPFVYCATDLSKQTQLFTASRKMVFSARAQTPFFSFSVIILKLNNDYPGPPLLNKLLQSK